MVLTVVQVDAFTSRPFGGNPAAVCVLPEARDEAWMSQVASEMNLSETAFLVRRGAGANEFDLRWFTPTAEVDLCGHATLAAAHVLWEDSHLDIAQTAAFHTRSGLLTAMRRGDWIELDFPATPAVPAMPPAGMIEALGVRPRFVGKSRFDYLVEIDGEEVVRDLRPDFARLAAAVPERGVIVTASSSTTDCDFVSRFFAPAAGIDEDPVTGSAHCCLAPYWHGRIGRSRFVAHQVSRRGGVLKVQLDRDRVLLAGRAVTVLRGELLV